MAERVAVHRGVEEGRQGQRRERGRATARGPARRRAAPSPPRRAAARARRSALPPPPRRAGRRRRRSSRRRVAPRLSPSRPPRSGTPRCPPRAAARVRRCRAMSSRAAKGRPRPVGGGGTSAATARIAGSSGCSHGLPLAARCTSILGCPSRLKPSTITRSTGDKRDSRKPRPGSGASRSSVISAQRRAEPTSTCRAPASRCSQESLPGRSTSKAWCACFTVETLTPRAVEEGDQPGQQGGLAGPAPAREADHAHGAATAGRADGGGGRRRQSAPAARAPGGQHGPARPGRFLFQPDAVVLLGPVVVHPAGAHALEGAFHAHRADVDVPEDGGDHHHRHQPVHDVRPLLPGDVGDREGEHQQVARQPRPARRRPSVNQYSAFCAALNFPAGGCPLATGPPALIQATSTLRGQVLAHPDRDHHQEAEHEGEGQVLVHRLPPQGERREGLRADDRPQHEGAVGDVEPGQAEQDEGARRPSSG